MSWTYRKRERLDGFEWLLDYAEGVDVLDLGCNRGLIGYEFAMRGAAFIRGIDSSERAVETACALFEDVNCLCQFEVMDLTRPEVLEIDNLFTVVVLSGVLHKLRRVWRSDDLAERFLRWAGDRVTAGGWFVFNGAEEEFPLVASAMSYCGLRQVSKCQVRDHRTAVWER